MGKFKIPQWFYLPTEQTVKASTTAGNFDAKLALQSKDAWVSTVSQTKTPKKKKILIADWTLEQQQMDLVQLQQFIQELLQAGFEVFIAGPDEPKQVNLETLSIHDFYHIPPQHKTILTEQMTRQGVSADELVLLDYDLIQEIAKENTMLYSIDRLCGGYNLAISSKLEQKNAQPLVMNSCYSLAQILPALDKDACIELASMQINRYDSILPEQKEKITTIILTDREVSDDYAKLKKIFPNLKQIYAHANTAVGFHQFLNSVSASTVALTLYQRNGEIISPEIETFIAKKKLQTIVFLPQVPQPAPVSSIISINGDRNEGEKIFSELASKTTSLTKINISAPNEGLKVAFPQLGIAPGQLPSVTDISLNNITIRLTSLIQLLQAAPNVQTLQLRLCEIQEQLTLTPNSLPEVTEFNLSNTTITVANLHTLLTAAPKVRNLSLGQCQIQGEINLAPNSLPEVTLINLGNTTITAANLHTLLTAAPKVRTLALFQCQIQDKLELTPHSLPEVAFLSLAITTITAANLHTLLTAVPKVRVLLLARCQIQEEIDLAPNSLLAINIITLNDSNIIVSSLANLLRAAPNVVRLELIDCADIEHLKVLLTDTKLLHLHYVKVSDELIKNAEFILWLQSIAPNLALINDQSAAIIFATCQLRGEKLAVLSKSRQSDDDIMSWLASTSSSTFEPIKHEPEDHANSYQQQSKIADLTGAFSSPTSLLETITLDQSTTSTQPATGIMSSNPTVGINAMSSTLDADTKFETSSDRLQACTGSIIPLVGAILFHHAREHVYQIAPDDHTIATNEVQATNFVPAKIAPTICTSEKELTVPQDLIEKCISNGSNLYQATQTFTCKPGQKYKLMSTTPRDQLRDLKVILGDPAVDPGLQVEYCTDDNFYYLTAKNACKLTAISLLEVKKSQPTQECAKVTELIKEFKAFKTPQLGEEGNFALDGITEASSGAEQLEAMYAQKKGACRHRAAAFLYQFNKLKQQDVKGTLKNVQARGVNGAVHDWLEISYNNGETWQIQDLGGYPAKLELTAVQQSELTKQLQTKLASQQSAAASTSSAAATQAEPPIAVAPAVFKAQPFASAKVTPKYRDVQQFLGIILPRQMPTQGQRILLEVPNQSMLEKMRKLAVLQTKISSTPTLAIDQYTDLLSTRPSVRIPDLAQSEWQVRANGSKLADFLQQPKTAAEAAEKVLLLDWTKLTAAQMVSVNGIIDDHDRQVDTMPVAANTTVIGLITPPQQPGDADFLEDSSFTSRHDQIIQVPFSEAELDSAISELAILAAEPATVVDPSAPMVIDLYDSPNWENLLFGQCTVNTDHREWRKGPLIVALEQGLPIVIQNGPWDDAQFARCIFDLTTTGKLTFYNQTIEAKTKPVVITRAEGYDFAALATQISKVIRDVTTDALPDLLPEGSSYVVNSATLERCFINEVIQNAKLVRNPGWLEMHTGQTISLLITDKLNLQQWTYLLEIAKLHNVKIQLNLAPSVELPAELQTHLTRLLASEPIAEPVAAAMVTTRPISAGAHIASKTQLASVLNPTQRCYCLTTTEPDCLAAGLQQGIENTVVLDVSELADEDLLYGNAFETAGETFKFNEKMGAIWKKLHEEPNTTVILKGKFSSALLSHLGSLFLQPSYLWHQGQREELKGRLVLVTEPNPACAFIAQQQELSLTPKLKQEMVFTELKVEPSTLPAIFTDYATTDQNALFTQPYPKILQAIKYAIAFQRAHGVKIAVNDALLGRYAIPPTVEKEPLDLSSEVSDNFAAQRKKAVDLMLGFSPCCVLESVAGTGKSSFIREYTALPKLLFSQDKLVEWIETKNKADKILFVDEANLANTDWTQFAGLFDTPATICIQGKIYSVPPECKVIFAQNPANYGGGREMPSLFVDHPSTVVFPPMPAAYMYQQILLPILSTKFSLEECEFIARNIFGKYDLAAFKEPEKFGLTARALQMDALKYCATTEAAEIIIQRLRAEKPQSSRQPYHVVTDTRLANTAEYVITPSRFAVDANLRDVIQIQQFRHQHAASAVTPALYGGQNALLLEGPPGVGKSELIKYLLAQHKFTEISEPSTEEPASNAGYYFIPASMSIPKKLALLEQAFQQGRLVVCEEINSSSVVEKYINSYLMGEDIHGKRPAHPGFALIGTYNSASLRGRALLSPALRSRALQCTLPEYDAAELQQILQAKFKAANLPAQFLQFVIDQFLLQQKEAGANKALPMPTLRDLLKAVKAHVEFVQGEAITLERHKQIFCQPKAAVPVAQALPSTSASAPAVSPAAAIAAKPATSTLTEPASVAGTLSPPVRANTSSTAGAPILFGCKLAREQVAASPTQSNGKHKPT